MRLIDFDAAEEMFEEILTKNPQRLQQADVYSNILYIKEDHARYFPFLKITVFSELIGWLRLASLAYKATAIDKYTPESALIIGIAPHAPHVNIWELIPN